MKHILILLLIGGVAWFVYDSQNGSSFVTNENANIVKVAEAGGDPIVGSAARFGDAIGDSASWYRDGSLHRVESFYWKHGSRDDKIATVADFLVNFRSVKKAILKDRDMSVLEGYSVAVMECLDSTFDNLSDNNGSNISEFLGLCTMTNGISM